jgi:small conductance mechanosensitive channel
MAGDEMPTYQGLLRVDGGTINELVTGSDSVSGDELLLSAIILIIGCAVAFLIGRWRRRRVRSLDDQVAQMVSLGSRMAQIIVIAISVGWSLTTLGASVGWLSMVLLVTGFVAVFAARPILEGMGASAALVSRPAFSVGDEIEVDDVVGEVVEITNRSTVIRRRDARRVHVPNVEMLSKTVTVYTVDQLRRSDVEVTVTFDSDFEQIERVLRDALSSLDAIERVGAILARELTEGVQFSVRIWHPSTIEEGNQAVDAAVRAIVTTLRREGIAFAPPTEVAIASDIGAAGEAGNS